jgi:hypothetical protein
MTKKMFHAVVLCGMTGVAMLCGGCVVEEGGYASGGVVYGEPGYARRGYYDDRPAYRETVVIDTGSRRRYSDGRQVHRAARDEHSRGSQYARGHQDGRGHHNDRGGQAQVQRGQQGRPGAGAARPQHGSRKEDHAQAQDRER